MKHVAVWMDHKEAKIFHLTPASFDLTTIHAPHAHIHRHEATTSSHEHPADDSKYFHSVACALAEAEEVLVVGPSTAKLHFLRHVRTHDPMIEKKIRGIETVDHPTDGQLVAYARTYFRAADRMG